MAILKLCITIPLLTTEDLTYTINLTGLSACAETSSATLVGCLPCLPRFVQFLRNRPDEASADGNRRPKRKPPALPSGSDYSYDSMKDAKGGLGIAAAPATLATTEKSPNRPITGAAQRVAPLDTSWLSVSSIEEEPRSPMDASSPQTLVNISSISSSSSRVPRRPTQSSLAGNTLASNSDEADIIAEPTLPTTTSLSSTVCDTPVHASAGSSSAPRNYSRSRLASPPARRASLSDRASSPASRRALRALAGRYWLDSEDGNRDRARHNSYHSEHAWRRGDTSEGLRRHS